MDNVTKEFSRETLQQVVWDDAEGFKKVSDVIEDTTRWEIVKTMVFQAPDGLHYQSTYTEGATEQQEQRPYEYESDTIECTQVQEEVVEVTQWVPVKK